MNPGMEEKFVGLQGDIFDSQRDMTCAVVGAIFCMVIAAIAQYEGELRDYPRPVALTDHERESIGKGNGREAR